MVSGEQMKDRNKELRKVVAEVEYFCKVNHGIHLHLIDISHLITTLSPITDESWNKRINNVVDKELSIWNKVLLRADTKERKQGTEAIIFAINKIKDKLEVDK